MPEASSDHELPQQDLGPMLRAGMYVHLCSGEVRAYPMATSSRLTGDTLLLFQGTELLETIPRPMVWFAGTTKIAPFQT